MKESFVVHTEYIQDLPKEFRLKYLAYIFNYGAYGIVPKVESLEKTIWKKIQRRMDADICQYTESILKNRCYVLNNKIKNNKATENEKQLFETYQQQLSSIKLNKLNETKQDLATYTPGVYDSDSVIDTEFESDTESVSDTVFDSDIESDTDNESVVVVEKNTTTTVSLEDIQKVIQKENLNVDAEYFYNYYKDQGFDKNWKRALRKWSQIEKKENAVKPESIDWNQKQKPLTEEEKKANLQNLQKTWQRMKASNE